jgi:carbon monoxide dehydrogenase subunit G
MKLENSFEVPASPAVAWDLLNDVPRVIPCMPGAELNEIVDPDTFKVTMHVKLGPIAFQFATDVHRDEVDEASGRTTLSARARDTKGRGGATAKVESRLEPAGDGSRVSIVTDVQLQGTVASMGRSALGPVASQMIAQFADAIAKELEATDTEPVATPAPVKPVGGLGLFLRSLWRRLRGI